MSFITKERKQISHHRTTGKDSINIERKTISWTGEPIPKNVYYSNTEGNLFIRETLEGGSLFL